MKSSIITIGDEILIGQVVDTNSAWLGSALQPQGIDIVQKISVGDDLKKIIEALHLCMNVSDLILITGGLGPTKDDITKTALANYFGVDMIYSEDTYKRIESILLRYGRKINDSHKHQCYMPANATLLKNKMGTAPGMLFLHNGKIIVSMPGVPFEMKSIVTEELIPYLEKNINSDFHIYHKTIMTAGEGESVIEENISAIIETLSSDIKIAYLPALGSVRVRISGRSKDEVAIKREVDIAVSQITAKLGKIVYGYDDITQEASLLQLFKSRGLTLSTAESCTGGYLAHKITSIAGSSTYFIGSLITYSNEMKINLLGVNPHTLSSHGAVSEDTVMEMVIGLLNTTKADIGIAISGIAGPDGGTDQKPVGTIWMAIGNHLEHKAFKIQGSKDRLRNIEYATSVALDKIRLFVEERYGL